MKENKITLQDGWSTDDGYKRLYQTDDEVAEVFESLELESAGSLLDNGCGNGEFSIRIAQVFSDLKVYGFDALDSAVSEARRKAKVAGVQNCDFNVGWAEELPISNCSFDRAIFRSVLHHIRQPELAFAELGRVIKSGGRLFLKTPCNAHEESFSDFLAELYMIMDSSHERFYHTPKQIEGMLKAEGFLVIKNEVSTFDFPYINPKMKELIVQNRFQHRVQLQQLSPEKCIAKLNWVSFVARRN